MNLDKLTESEKFVVKWQYHLLGDFKTALIEAIKRADDSNLFKLSVGFPDEVNGYLKYTREDGWWQEVQKKASIEVE